MEVHSRPVQHGVNEENVQTRDSANQELLPDSPEATNAGAQAGTKENGHSPPNDVQDDVSISSEDLMDARVLQPVDFKKPEHYPHFFEACKEKGPKYARVAALYTETLENRVGVLEKELLELHYEVGSKERPYEKRQAMPNIVIPRCPLF